MKKILLLTLLFPHLFTATQEDNSWTAFTNSESNFIGIKDKNGDTTITPKFVGFTTAKKFDEIIAVVEDDNHPLLFWFNKFDFLNWGIDIGV